MNNDFWDNLYELIEINQEYDFTPYYPQPKHKSEFKISFHHYNDNLEKDILNTIYSKTIMNFLQRVEKDLEYIINSPSTINGIFKYYHTVIDYEHGIITLWFYHIPIRVWQMVLEVPKEHKNLINIK